VSKLKVNKGIKQPGSVNKDAAKKFIKLKRKQLSLDDYYKGIISGDIAILSKAITIVESQLKEHRKLAGQIIEKCLPHSGNSIRIGITGVPGVGKSTFIESFGQLITQKNNKLAVLAIDPSSTKTKGSILGDKTRMEKLSQNPKAFIRPSPSAGSLGGVGRKTAETMILCEAAGFNYIFIETVGVGQSETLVHSMVDFFLLLMLAGAGDELQGIKRGIMEMADMIAITKADGNNKQKAELAKIEYQNALHLFPMPDSGVNVEVLTCSAINNNGLNNIYNGINKYINTTKQNGYFFKKRKLQLKHRLEENINEQLKSIFFSNPVIKNKLKNIETNTLNSNINIYKLADDLINIFLKNSNTN